ncbi:hypothetical protein ACU686_10005 [Yinghuangia aomiensis]
MWTTSLAITASVYGLFIVAGGVTVMAYESVQTRYAAKQIGLAPGRLVPDGGDVAGA